MTYPIRSSGPISQAIRDLDRRVQRLEPRIVNGDSDTLTVLPRGVTRRSRAVSAVPTTPTTATARWA
jgi:trans-2-enoyl-CoA reductase